jgi:1,2-phenylacetyl-CoA epoxidase catalytic subunit
LSGLGAVALRKVLSEKVFQLSQSQVQCIPFVDTTRKHFGVQELLDFFVHHVVGHFEEYFLELLEDFLDGYLVDYGISIEPLQVLENAYEHTTPVGGEF